jgi:hypothetical protein
MCPLGLVLSELCFVSKFFLPTFFKVLLFEWLFPMLSSLQSFSSGFLGMTIRTDFDALIKTILAI